MVLSNAVTLSIAGELVPFMCATDFFLAVIELVLKLHNCVCEIVEWLLSVVIFIIVILLFL